MHPALLYRGNGSLSVAELTALRLDGVLFEVGDAYVPADIPETASLRVLSLAPLLKAEVVITGTTAAWVHGAGDAQPDRCHIRSAEGRRLRIAPDSRMVLHDGFVADHEMQSICGIRVLTVTATLVDLARTGQTAGARTWLAALAALQPTAVAPAIAALHARNRLPGKRAAVALLESVYEEVTRYTS